LATFAAEHPWHLLETQHSPSLTATPVLLPVDRFASQAACLEAMRARYQPILKGLNQTAQADAEHWRWMSAGTQHETWCSDADVQTLMK